ncbi:hypothetical protein EDM76_11360 [bacterium]|nr:MAG: hypothetical protein EDM76_11360 [bacterium]
MTAYPIEKTIRVADALRQSLEQFIESPLSEAREADVVARMAEYRDAVRAGLLVLPRVIRRKCNERTRRT